MVSGKEDLHGLPPVRGVHSHELKNNLKTCAVPADTYGLSI